MANTRRFWALVKKEFYTYVNSPLAYVVIVPFLLITTFLYFRTALMLGDANLRPFIELLPWFLIVIGPALAMRTFNDEKRKDTLELLFAHPLNEWAIVLAKYCGLILFYLLFLGSTLALPLTLILFSNPDIGLMISQYLGAVLLGAVFLAVGMTASVFISHVVGSFLVGAAFNFALVITGLSFITLMLPPPLNIIITESAVITRISNLSRGVIDLRDIAYFITLVGIILTIAVFKLSERQLAENKHYKNRLYLVLGLIAGIGISLNVALFDYPIRLDMTTNQRYSLSSGTKQLLRELPDRVNITLYSSTNLPGPLQLTLRETSDRLKDFARHSDRVLINSVLVANDQDRSEAVGKGIREITFNQIGAGSFQVAQGLLGLEVRFADQSQVIDFIQEAADLEYELSRMILNMTREEKPVLAKLSLGSNPGFQQLESLLTENYELSTYGDFDDISLDYDYAGVIVVDSGGGDSATAAAVLTDYISEGGNALILVDGVSLDPQMLTAQPSESAMLRTLSRWGIEVQPNMVYDLQHNEAISLGGGGIQYIVPYPFWLRSTVNSAAVPWIGSTTNVLLGWPSEIKYEPREGYSVQPLLLTSAAAGTQSQAFNISPEQLNQLEPPLGEELVLGVIAQHESQRIVLIGNTRWVTDEFLINTPENSSFIINLADWVAADEILSTIPKRTQGRTLFTFSSEAQAQMVQWVVLLLPSFLVSLSGYTWLRRRRLRTKRVLTLND